MADHQAGTAPVVDRRPTPTGVVPRHIQTWLMVGLAAAILGIIVFTGQPAPASPTPAGAGAPQMAASPERLRDYQARLQNMNERAREQRVVDAQTTPPPAARVTPVEYESVAPAAPDPIQTERRRRDYESLFASNVVLSRRPDLQAVANPGTAGSGNRTTPPSLEDVADAVVRATSRYGSPTADANAQPSAGPSTPPAPTMPVGASLRPASTRPISSNGPLHPLLEGTVIETVLTNRLDGSVAAPVNCLVTSPVFSHDGQYVLIPAGARVLGETKPVQSFGETRLAVAFNRLVMPDGSTYRLDQFMALNDIGQAGLTDQVDQHYRSTFGASSAVGLITGLTQFLGTKGMNSASGGTVVIAGSAGDATAQATAQTFNRLLNRLPTVTVREGHRVKVYLTSDLVLPAYAAREGASPAPASLSALAIGERP
jgi:type IV secretion system protein VirB10